MMKSTCSTLVNPGLQEGDPVRHVNGINNLLVDELTWASKLTRVESLPVLVQRKPTSTGYFSSRTSVDSNLLSVGSNQVREWLYTSSFCRL